MSINKNKNTNTGFGSLKYFLREPGEPGADFMKGLRLSPVSG